MNKSTLVSTSIAVLFLLNSCSHKVNRIGYSEKPLDLSTTCDVVIQKNDSIIGKQYEKLGSIKLKDSGFSTSCNELDAIAILKKEACSIGGNLINIIEEKRPSFASSCYQCTADIYRIHSDSLAVKVQESGEYDSYETMDRVKQDKKRNQAIFWTSFAVGFVIGFILVL